MSNSPLNGTWYSAVGSKLILEVNGTEITGKFDSTQDPGAFVPVTGVVADVTAGSDFIPIAFTASWPGGDGYSPSVTSYTGQYTEENGVEKIETIFLLADQEQSTVLWRFSRISSDVFTRRKSK